MPGKPSEAWTSSRTVMDEIILLCAGGAQMWMEEHAPKERVNVIREGARRHRRRHSGGRLPLLHHGSDGLAAIDATMEVGTCRTRGSRSGE